MVVCGDLPWYKVKITLNKSKIIQVIWTTWWLSHPFWNILVKLEYLPRLGFKIKNGSNHHLVIFNLGELVCLVSSQHVDNTPGCPFKVMAAMAWCLLLMDTPVDCAFDFWIRNWISTQASGHHVIKYPQGIDTPSTKHKNWNLDEIYSTLISPFVNWWFFGPSGEPKVQCPKSSTAFWARAPVHLAAHIVPTHSEPQACCSFPKKRRNKQWSIFRKQLYIPIWRLLYTKLNFVNWSNILYIYTYIQILAHELAN